MKNLSLFCISILISFYGFAQNDPDSLVVLNPDYANVKGGEVVKIPILDNDTINTMWNLQMINASSGGVAVEVLGFSKIVGDTLFFEALYDHEGQQEVIVSYLFTNEVGNYTIKEAKAYIDVEGVFPNAILESNNIRTNIRSNGALFWDYENSCFEVPVNENKSTIRTSGFWIGGKDEQDSLHFAGTMYSINPFNAQGTNQGFDFFYGPQSNVYDTAFYYRWIRSYVVTRAEISFHILNYMNLGYEPVDVIKNWPAHGIVENGEMEYIAPFEDVDSDGVYNPYNGDYPLIRGDQAAFVVFNDTRYPHTETHGGALGIQVHLMAYEYNNPNDELLNNTLFLHYDIFNLSENFYSDMFVGMFTQFEIGSFRDDAIASDVLGSSFYGYNKDAVDDEYNLGTSYYPLNDFNLETFLSYEDNPPAQSTTILKGPFMESDNLDNPEGELDYSCNGNGFGDGIIDNERLGMTNFISFTHFHPFAEWFAYPEIDVNYYNSMNSVLRNGTPLKYSFSGLTDYPENGINARFMFPGDSDPDNWGTDGIDPSGWTSGDYWLPADNDNCQSVSGVGSCGPFIMGANEKQEFDVAYIYAQPEQGDNHDAVDLLRDRIAELHARVDLEEITDLTHDYTGLENAREQQICIYPNPVNETLQVTIESIASYDKIEYVIYDLKGSQAIKGTMINKGRINIKTLDSGVYILRVIADQRVFTDRIIVNS
jgi:hypothetical protein